MSGDSNRENEGSSWRDGAERGMGEKLGQELSCNRESSAKRSHPSPSARWGGAQLEPLHSPGDRVTPGCRGSVS